MTSTKAVVVRAFAIAEWKKKYNFIKIDDPIDDDFIINSITGGFPITGDKVILTLTTEKNVKLEFSFLVERKS